MSPCNNIERSQEHRAVVMDKPPSSVAVEQPAPRTRIAFVSETWLPEINGVTHTLHHLARHLIERDFRVQLIRPRPKDHTTAAMMSEELQVRAIPIPDYDGVSMGMPAVRQLRQFWTTSPPDVVYIATEGPLGMAALHVARRLNLPIISGYHTNFDQYSRYYILLQILRPLVRPFLRHFHNRTLMTLVPTSGQAHTLTSQGYDNVRVLGRGLDCRQFTPDKRSPALRREWHAPAETPVILHVGRLAAEKNVELLERTLNALRQRHPALCAVLVGDGPLRAQLEERLPWVNFAGFQRGEALTRYYASADMFLFPSLSETFGNVVTEAMASGLAVVAFDYAAAGELISDGHDGRLVPLRDPNAFIATATALSDDKALVKSLGAAARERVRALAWPSIGDAFIEYLSQAQEVTGARRARISGI
ncbi:glycosyltransferase involved in cell wall biosynthesis [Kushneria sinocarnis]|uniref:Glycosyltransferase involved in cell wall biosynthesis n=1 Tax=Kushneria sinocarnis TaxID=595502 RepID=A0A420WY51_9GAMM|nr:glycosyltransferase family 1 protein [Kushneria sinocarnis]RKR06142.1 glycosyltransferase involved in cell wall biosynthesis [Kushneria sinocarnis]